jgi:hypothetical protein
LRILHLVRDRPPSLAHGTLKHQAKHFFYAAGWKKFEPLWDLMIRARQLRRVTPVLEAVLAKVTRKPALLSRDRDATNPLSRKGRGDIVARLKQF